MLYLWWLTQVNIADRVCNLLSDFLTYDLCCWYKLVLLYFKFVVICNDIFNLFPLILRKMQHRQAIKFVACTTFHYSWTNAVITAWPGLHYCFLFTWSAIAGRAVQVERQPTSHKWLMWDTTAVAALNVAINVNLLANRLAVLALSSVLEPLLVKIWQWRRMTAQRINSWQWNILTKVLIFPLNWFVRCFPTGRLLCAGAVFALDAPF